MFVSFLFMRTKTAVVLPRKHKNSVCIPVSVPEGELKRF